MISPVSEIKLLTSTSFFVRTTVFLILGPGAAAAAAAGSLCRAVRRLSAPRYTYWLN